MSIDHSATDVPPGSPAIAPITDPSVIAEGIDLYRTVFHAPASECTMAPRLLAAMAGQGGFVLGAHIGDTLVGFAYGFTGITGRATGAHLYLQLIVVHPAYQNLGIGRRLMAAIAHHARVIGVHRVRWAFDPRNARNAHFYLDVIGAQGRWFVPNMYGTRPSHRVIAEWDVSPSRARLETTDRYDDCLELVECGTAGRLPSRSSELFYTRLGELLSAGYELVSCSVEQRTPRWYLRRVPQLESLSAS
ncbi:GNAT family N-acetyltransferase [Nocardia sp. NPDC127579]|uniref:GNAT family N-acetyltransferase n=1 Tax=Nocardia sp. NPDC127579 TaxID=3345402 RepID=UPI00362D6A4D